MRALGLAQLVRYYPDMPHLSHMRWFLNALIENSNDWSIEAVFVCDGRKGKANILLNKGKLCISSSMTGGREDFHLIEKFSVEWFSD